MFINAIAMFLDDFLPPPPILIGHYQGLDLFAEGQGFALPRVRDMLAEDPDRYSDLCGRTVGLVMPLLDWRGQKLPFCVTACIDDQVAAAAWAGTITSRDTGAQGCNVSFGLRPAFGGKGLATILTAIAYQQCLADAPDLEFVNVHTEASNLGACALAAKLELRRAELFDRQTRGRTPRLYVAYRAPAALVTARCAEILTSAGVEVHAPSRHLTARPQVPDVQPRAVLPPSIAALLLPFAAPLKDQRNMQDNHVQQAHFLISVDATSPDEIDTSTMRAGIEQAVDIARNEAMLTQLADETTRIDAIRVSAPSTPAAALLLVLGPTIADTPAARRAVEVAVAAITRQYGRDRVTILTEEERQHLLTGMAEARKAWQRDGDDDWISDVIHNGYDGYALEPDVVVIENAFCDHPIFRHLTDDASRLAVLKILAKPEVLDLIVSKDRAQPVNDLDQFDEEILRAVGPMTSARRTSRPEDVLLALQLHGTIRQMLAERLGVHEDAGEDEDEDEENTTAPRG